MSKHHLILIRHAKSSWDDRSLPDDQRPLSARGRREARAMAKRLRPRIARPDVVLCSPARRAQDTARVIVRALHYRRKDIVLCAQLYRHRAVEQLEVIRATGARCKRLMLFGHNPQLSTLAHQLGAPTTKLSTCAVLRLVFDIDSWSRIGRAALIRFALDRPARSRTKRR